MNGPDNGMDQISAHLDRGWALIAQKSYRKAAFSARQVLELDPENPDAYTLIGLAALGERDAEEALEAFERAMELDPDFLAPVVYSAEALGMDPERLDEALARLDEAYELVDRGTPEWVDAVLLHVDLLIGAGDDDGARRKLGQLSPEMLTLLDQQVQAGKHAVQLDELDLAERALAPVLKRGNAPADALYSLAQIAERRGDLRRALKLSLATREADLAQLDQLELPDPQELRHLCQAAIATLPPDVRDVVESAEMVVLDAPAMELVADGMDPWLPLLLTGPPPEQGGPPGAASQAAYLFLYRLNLRFESPDPDERRTHLAEHLTDAVSEWGRS